jgi:hypothetical protein
VQGIFGPLSTTIAGILGGVQGTVTERVFTRSPTTPSLAVTVKTVVLPIRRASVHLEMKVNDLVSSKDFTEAVGMLGTTLLFDGAGRSDLARAQIAGLVRELPEAAVSSCAAPAAAPVGTSSTRAAACRAALDKVLKSGYDAAMAGKPSGADSTAIENVDTQFRALAVNALSSNTNLDITFKNRPVTHLGFGAGTAVIAYGRVNNVRVKIDDDSGTIVSDPLPRVITMAVVNWSPTGYDEGRPALLPSERFRPFFGAALTPDFGVIGGVNVLLVRGIGAVAGAGEVFGKGADANEVGKAPMARKDPFRLAAAHVVFFGISYSYK